MILFGRDKNCSKTICPQCLMSEHKFHDVQIFDEQKDKAKCECLASKIDSLSQKVYSKRNEILAAKQEAEREKVICVKALKDKRVRIKLLIDLKFGELNQAAEAELNTDLETKLVAIDENLKLLASMKEISAMASVTNEEVTGLLKSNERHKTSAKSQLLWYRTLQDT